MQQEPEEDLKRLNLKLHVGTIIYSIQFCGPKKTKISLIKEFE